MVKVRESMAGWKMWEHGVPDSKWIVIEQADDYVSSDGRRYAQWLCECSCEKHTQQVVLGNGLKTGHSKSCGCIRSEVAKKYNRYDLTGSYGIGWTSNTNKEFYFELNRYDEIKNICWREHINKRDGFHTLIGLNLETGKTVKMHVLLGYKGCDHIDHNELNNLENNLRPCTLSQNSMNQSLSKRNTSGVIGVYWFKPREIWRAQIKKEGRVYCLGYFHNKDDAIRARLTAEIKYFGDFAPQKHLFKQYDIKFDN